jgi:hypothetical protein
MTKVLNIQVQPERVPELDESKAIEFLKIIGSGTDLIKHFDLSEGHDNGRYINFNYSTDDLPGLWSLIKKEVLDAPVTGSMIKRAAIIVCEGDTGWDNYLLLHHFDEKEKLDSL